MGGEARLALNVFSALLDREVPDEMITIDLSVLAIDRSHSIFCFS